MLLRRATWIGSALIILAGLAVSGATAATIPPVVRGEQALMLLPEPGPLTVTISKRDMNIYEGADDLVADLYDPRRLHLARVEIPDDGVTGKGRHATEVQTATMQIDADAPGAYRLVISSPTRGDFVHGVETSSGGAMVEGSTILLNRGDESGRIFFAPPEPGVTVRCQALHDPGRQEMPLYDAAGELLHTFDMTETGLYDEFEAPEDADRSGPWHLDCEAMDIRCEVPGMNYFTINEDSFFEASSFQHMLYPYTQTRYLMPGESASLTYDLRNQTGADDAFALEATGDGALTATVTDPASPLELSAERYANIAPITVQASLADDAEVGAEYITTLTATSQADPTVVESAGIRVICGEAPVSEPLDMPIVLQPYQHENHQFGYAPEYIENEVYFDLDNRPYIRHRTEHRYPSNFLQTLEEGEWVERSFIPTLEEKWPSFQGFYMGGGFLGAKWAFDGDNGAYTTAHMLRGEDPRMNVLVFTPDAGRTFSAHEFDGDRHDIEQFTGHNALPHPPPVLSYEQIAPHDARFCAYHNLWLYTPERDGDTLEPGEPILVSDRCLGSCQHSGGPASTVTRDGKTHIVWGEVTEEDVPGVPSYIATYDHESGELSEPVFMAYAPPVNDVHNVPAVTMDSEGYIHVVTGAHGDNFKYLRSLEPNDTRSGWTEPVNVLEAGRVEEDTDEDGRGAQTYISLVCDQDDNLHIAFRQWRAGVDPYHGGNLYAALSMQTKPKDGEWGPARPLVVPAVDGYSIYYHKLTTDRLGNLYLSYNYYTSDHTYQPDFPEQYHNRAVIVSKDGGETWKLAQTEDFAEEIIANQ
ncbi:MAG: BNR-4 repeat-containing protein [Armatimonadota bacterium]